MNLRRGLPPGHASPLRRVGLAPAVVLFTILVAHAILETARDALFLARLGPHLLASAYLAMAGCAVVAVVALRRLGARDPRGLLLRVLVIATLGTTALAATIASSHAVVFALYVWTGFIITLIVPSFWTAIDRSSKIAEAKRVFGMIGAGGVLGAMVGSAVAGGLGRVLEAHYLVVVGAAAFGLATVAAAVLVPRASVEEPRVRAPRIDALSQRSRRYVQLLLAIGLVSTIMLTLGDLTFKRVIAERLTADQLATVFGLIYTGLNAVALVIQVAVTPRLLTRWGMGVTLTVLPLILVLTALGFALTGALVAVLALKLGDGGLRHSLHRVTSELLYLPLPSAVRDGGKLIADALGQRGGQAIAALIALGLASLGATTRGVAAVTAATGVVWLAMAVRARRAYIAQFRDTLQAGEIQRDVAIPRLDADSIRLLSELVASPNEVEALAALDLLARRARIPPQAFTHPRAAVVRHALLLLDGELPPDVVAPLARLRAHPDPEIRAAALAASTRTDFDRERLRSALGDRDPHVRAAALVGLAAHDDGALDVAEGIAALAAGSLDDRLALVSAIAFWPEARFAAILGRILERREPAVVRSVLHVLAHNPELAALDRVLGFLEEPGLRADARRVFVATGRRGLELLIGALDDPRTPRGVRRHVPRTISLFGSDLAAAALVARLGHEPDGRNELKILRALGRMRADHPGLAIDPAPVRAYVQRAVGDAARYATFGDQLAETGPPASPAGQLIREIVADKRRTAIEHAFRALGILYPRAGLRSVHDAIVGRDDARRGAAREIVEATVPNDVRVPLLAAIDELPAARRRARLGGLAPGPFASYEAVISALLADPSESLRCVVAYHVAEQHMVALRDELERLRPPFGPQWVVRAFDQAMARLDG